MSKYLNMAIAIALLIAGGHYYYELMLDGGWQKRGLQIAGRTGYFIILSPPFIAALLVIWLFLKDTNMKTQEKSVLVIAFAVAISIVALTGRFLLCVMTFSANCL